MSPFWEVAFRAVVAYVGMLVVTRLLGKEQMHELTPADFVNAIAVGSIAAEMAFDHRESVFNYIIAISVFGGLTYLTNYLPLKSRPLRKLLEGEPAIVIHNGKILEKNMSKEHYHMENLTMQLREKNVFNIADVEFAVLEPNGQLSVLLKSSKQPLTASDVKVSTSYQGLSAELIVDGFLIRQNLQQNNLSEAWLLKELEKQGIGDIKAVSYASLDTSGKLFVDTYQDKLKQLQKVADED